MVLAHVIVGRRTWKKCGFTASGHVVYGRMIASIIIVIIPWQGEVVDRVEIIVRRNVRKRWQRLGVWNPGWGVPGRVNGQLIDSTWCWKWKWQSSGEVPASRAVSLANSASRHLVDRAVQLRRNHAYGEYAPPRPHSHLTDDSSLSEAEPFISTRPWFVYILKAQEFYTRLERIPNEKRVHMSDDEWGQVQHWWKERGDWKPGWKWRYESPSPPPEDLEPFYTGDMDFTPSELDAFEAISLSPPLYTETNTNIR
ncbi:hypothetical protein F5Y15DRAFT_399455 [Xylariaceae sp. FL0016]|nr:hypothetical protein F5Y15DRAFT_399455 [Xylariaceae sp. FL0016]